MRGVIRFLLPVAADGAFLEVSPGCAGDGDSEVCGSLRELQSAVQDLRDIDLDDTSAEEVEQAARAIVADAIAVKDAADEELGQEVETFEATVQALAADVQETSAQGELTRESLAEIGTAVASTVTAFQTIQEAAPDETSRDGGGAHIAPSSRARVTASWREETRSFW